MKKDAQSTKASLRKCFKKLRSQISDERRFSAEHQLLDSLYPILQPYKHILSFASLRSEMNLLLLNQKLAEEGRLYLPRLEGKKLIPYYVPRLKECLTRSSFGVLEPCPDKCQQINSSQITCILVPGLSFDSQNYRLGYGAGHYDYFLKDLLQIPTYGIGFKEQFIDELPIEPHDVPLTKVFLF